jgi:hypothetical protein
MDRGREEINDHITAQGEAEPSCACAKLHLVLDSWAAASTV